MPKSAPPKHKTIKELKNLCREAANDLEWWCMDDDCEGCKAETMDLVKRLRAAARTKE